MKKAEKRYRSLNNPRTLQSRSIRQAWHRMRWRVGDGRKIDCEVYSSESHLSLLRDLLKSVEETDVKNP